MSSDQFRVIYWIFLLIVSVNIALRTEHHQGDGEHLLNYTMLSPSIVFLSRLVFNVCYLFIVGVAFYLALLLLFYPQITFDNGFMLLIALGAIGISAALSFIAAIARHGTNQNTVVSVLSIPVLIPVILILYGLSGQTSSGADYLILLSISLLSIALSLILFPFVWKQ